jgi:hypothetical protein
MTAIGFTGTQEGTTEARNS